MELRSTIGAAKENTKRNMDARRIELPWFTKSRFELISKLRDEAKKMFERKQRFLGWLQGERKRA